MPDKPNVFQLINAVSADLSKDGIGKDSYNEQQKFKFRGIDAVVNALSSLLAKHGLVIMPVCIAREVAERVTKSGGTMLSVSVMVRFVFTSAHDGSQTECIVPGEAMDSGDKATNKAMSAAYKYMVNQSFCVPFEGQDDADLHSPEESVPKEVATLVNEVLEAATALGKDGPGAVKWANNSPTALRNLLAKWNKEADSGR